MTIDVVVYLSSLNKIAGRKKDVLEAFATGARSVGARVQVTSRHEYIPAKLAVILGWPSPEQHGINVRLRAAVVKEQKRRNQYVMAIDGSTFKFHDQDGKYLRYSINGVFYDTSQYANRDSDSTRWDIISKDLKLSLDPWRPGFGYVLLLMQRDGGWSMKGLDPIQWAMQTYNDVRRQTDLPIIIRPHPGKVMDLSALQTLQNVHVTNSKQISLQENLSNARAACVFNSSSGVASVLKGIPLVVNDRSSVCWDVAEHSVEGINYPAFKDRTQWIYDLAAAHWSDEESAQGHVLNKFLPYLT